MYTIYVHCDIIAKVYLYSTRINFICMQVFMVMKEGFEICVHFSDVLFCLNLGVKISKQIFRSVVTSYEFKSYSEFLFIYYSNENGYSL